MSGPPPPAKQALRDELLAARRRRTPEQSSAVEQALAAHLLVLAPVARARRVAAYRSMPDEPGTGPFIAGLHARGAEVLLPVTLDDGSLDWVVHVPDAPTRRSRLGVEEPTGERLGAGALVTADVVALPALAADHAGRRLGRGAGYYDRALADLGPRGPLLVALVHADELLPAVPHESHDVPVQVVVTETGVFRVPHDD